VDGTSFAAGTPFDTTWVIQNTGTTSWNLAEVDIRYVGAAAGVPLHQGSDIYDLTATVQPDTTYNFSVPMIAPFEPGTFGEVWEVIQGNTPICQFYVYIAVQ
jgi:hypothetical protein